MAKSPGKPLDQARLDDLALGYVARFATTGAKLHAYLARKLRERGWAGDGEVAAPPPDLAALVERLTRAGYIDDAAFARGRRAGLLRRGYGARRVEQALGAAGVAAAVRAALRPDEVAARAAVLAFARKRGLGPFGVASLARGDRARREKQLAALLRAGHPLDTAREIVDAPSVVAAETWAAAGGEEDE